MKLELDAWSRNHRPLRDRFNAGFQKGGPDECWPWLKGKVRGYGLLRYKGKLIRVRYLAYCLAYGKPLRDNLIVSTCNNPACVNPNHLFAATRGELSCYNMAKGRHRGPAGSVNQGAKLTEVDVVEIRNSGEPVKQIAARFGVLPTTVYDIRNRKSWRHVT